MKAITKIVITGGPCAGKSTAMSWIQNAFTAKGYRVLFVPETATELISNGVAPWLCNSNLDYQVCQIKLQAAKEEIFELAAKNMPEDKILIVCDRGILDNKAYMTDKEFSDVMKKLKFSEVSTRDTYDAVFHLVTAANGASKFYTLANNGARTETPQQAIELDAKTVSAWVGHPHLRVIDNSTDFEGKMKRLISEISSFLGEPEPLETERKYLIKYPNVDNLVNYLNAKSVEIIQTYLKSEDPDIELRVRQRGSGDDYVYFLTEKRNLFHGASRVEIERRLSQQEYLEHLMQADTSFRQIRKTRYCFEYSGQYFELDLYPFWNNQAILEIELESIDDIVSFPDYLKDLIIREVTYDEEYKNASLAKNIPNEG